MQPDRTTLAVLRIWVLAWLLILIIGAVIFGRRWIGAADPFETYASHRGPVVTVAPGVGAAATGEPARRLERAGRRRRARAAVVAVLLGSTAFDSFANTSWWISTVQDSDLRRRCSGRPAGLLIMIMIVLGTFCGGRGLDGAVRCLPGGLDRATLPRVMAGSLVPIVVGYAIAHYFTLLVVEGQRTALGLSDPLGLGWNVFGTAELGVDARIFEHPTAVAIVQLLAIVARPHPRHRRRPREGGDAAARRPRSGRPVADAAW